MKQIPLSQGKVAIVDDEDYETLSRHKWHCGSKGYAVRKERRGLREVHVWMHREIMQPANDMQVDHVNGEKADNRRCNLRIATNSHNLCNRGANANNTSGFKGVTWKEHAGKWMAFINLHGKQKHLGYFDTAEDGARAYNEAAKKYHGVFARLNEV